MKLVRDKDAAAELAKVKKSLSRLSFGDNSGCSPAMKPVAAVENAVDERTLNDSIAPVDTESLLKRLDSMNAAALHTLRSSLLRRIGARKLLIGHIDSRTARVERLGDPGALVDIDLNVALNKSMSNKGDSIDSCKTDEPIAEVTYMDAVTTWLTDNVAHSQGTKLA